MFERFVIFWILSMMDSEYFPLLEKEIVAPDKSKSGGHNERFSEHCLAKERRGIRLSSSSSKSRSRKPNHAWLL